MIVLKQPDPKFKKLTGDVNPDRAKTYRPLRFLIPLDGEDGHRILNTLTSEVICLDDAEYSRFASLPAAFEPWMDELIRKRFLVEKDHDEKSHVQLLRSLAKAFVHPGLECRYTILPTSACNAGCYYCFESSDKAVFMTEETADDVVRFIAGNSRGGEVSINWFGGEPLLGEKIIDRITGGLDTAGIQFRSLMLTNGYLFSRELADKAVRKWNLRAVQITLDGTEQEYNRIKNYRGNPEKSPFLTVIGNMEYLLDAGAAVRARLNMGPENSGDIFRLVDVLSERFGRRENFDVYSMLLFEGCGYRPLQYGSGEKERLRLLSRELEMRIREKFPLRKPKGIPGLRTAFCTADRADMHIINPDGDLVMCESRIFADVIGNVREGFTVPEELRYKNGYFEYAECGGCPFYPTCVLPAFCPSFGREKHCGKKERKTADTLSAMKRLSAAGK